MNLLSIDMISSGGLVIVCCLIYVKVRL